MEWLQQGIKKKLLYVYSDTAVKIYFFLKKGLVLEKTLLHVVQRVAALEIYICTILSAVRC